MCIEPPLPPLRPLARPNSSAIIVSMSAPLASVWPWPRWVEVSWSSRVRLRQTPAATASWPVDRCSGPRTLACAMLAPKAATPPFEASSAAFSNARMRAIVRKSSSARVGIVREDASGRRESDKASNNPCPQSIRGEVAEWGDKCYGLQSRLRWFDSNLRLHPFQTPGSRQPSGLSADAELSRPLLILNHRSEGLARSPSEAPIARRVRHPHRTTPAVS